MNITFHPSNLPLAKALGKALTDYANGVYGVPIVGEPSGATVAALTEAAATAGANVDSPAVTSTVDELAVADVQAQEQHASAIVVDDASGAREDEHGVKFDAKYCANAADPFYGSGKTKGQWKKARGVSQDIYDAWYAGERSLVASTAHAEATAEPDPATTAAAFGGGTKTALPMETIAGDPIDPANLLRGPQPNPACANGPGVMHWISELQTAGHIDALTVEAVMSKDNISAAVLFAPGGEQMATKLHEAIWLEINCA